MQLRTNREKLPIKQFLSLVDPYFVFLDCDHKSVYSFENFNIIKFEF